MSELTLAKGNKQPFEVVGHYVDGSSRALTDLSVTDWHTSNPNVGRFDELGAFIGVEVGSTTVTVTKDGITSNAVTVNVSAAVITAIQVTPSPVNLAKDITQQLVATARYSDGTSSPVTSSVTWTSGDTNTVTVTSEGLLSGVEVGSTTLTAMKDGITSNTVTVNVSVITSIQVAPVTVNLAKGQTEQLTATATYSNGSSSDISSSVTWALDDTNTAMLTSSGLLSGVEMGNATLTATKDGITSNAVTVNVSAAVITAIQVTPSSVNVPKGQMQQLVAMAMYSDGTSSSVTSSVTWMPEDPNTATVTSAGLLSGVESGSTTLTATKDGITSNTVTVNVSAVTITRIEVTPSPVINLSKGITQQLVAMATYSDGTSSPVTSSVTWISDNTNTATVTLEGLLRAGRGVGSTTVMAMKDNLTSNTVTVNISSIISTEVIPATLDLVKGQTQQLTAMATLSNGSSIDISSPANWTSHDTNIATVTSTGMLFGVEVGTTTLTVMKDGFTSSPMTVNVALPTSIQVKPSVNVVKDGTKHLTATMMLSNGSSLDVSDLVTWVSDDTDIVTVTSTGVLSGVEVGNTTVTATKHSLTSNTVNVEVCAKLVDTCIETFDVGSGKLFTNSPSEAYLDSIGGSANNGIYTESGNYGPAGRFYQFRLPNAHTLCATYNSISLGGRTNWRLPIIDELMELSGTMFADRGWPSYRYYFSTTIALANGSFISVRDLSDGIVVSLNLVSPSYVSCVSEP